jgi:protein phosphatase
VEVTPAPGERYLLCSDGLFSVVPDATIGEILADRRQTLAQLCDRLIEAANGAGGPDNITTLILQVDAP